MPSSPRYGFLDTLRGLTLLSMIAFHTTWDLVFLFGVPFDAFRRLPGEIWQQSICWVFLILSGFCWSLGKHPLRRGLIVSAGGLITTAVTLIFTPSTRIIFGILTLLGFLMIVMIPLRRLFDKIPPEIGLPAAFLLFFPFYPITQGYLGLYDWVVFLEMPYNLYHGLFATFWGLKDPTFFSADYYPVFPWIFLFFTGYFLFRLWDKYGRPGKWLSRQISPLAWIGRHTLPIYLVHQPIIYGILMLIKI